MSSVSPFLMGQAKIADSLSNNYGSGDTAVTENIIKMPEFQDEKVPEKASPALPVIPMNIPGTKPADFPINKTPLQGYAVPWPGTGNPNFSPDFLTNTNRNIYYNQGKLYLSLNLEPPKNILELIRENPLRALIYGAATFAGMMNNTIMGEDKMNKIRLDNMVQSRKGIPETMISGQGTVYYEIDIRKNK
jgi:hypothetical protein